MTAVGGRTEIMMRLVKIFSVILAVIVTAVLAVAFIGNRNREAELVENAAQLDAMLKPLYTKIRDLENSKIVMENEFNKEINGTGTVSLLYTEAVSAVYDTIYPEMSEYGYCGLVALSDAAFPGSEGYMSLEELTELLDAGWKWCVTFPADSASPEADVRRLLTRADAAGIGRSSLIYFPEESYSRQYDTWLTDAGFMSVMHHGEEERAVIAKGGTDDGIFYQGAVNWRSKRRRDYLSAAVSDFGSIAFEMNIRPDHIEADVAYHTSMLDVIEEYCSRGGLSVMTPNEANRYHLSVESGSEEHAEVWQNKKDEINAQISELWAEIARIRRQYTESLTD